jgi:hypothetical protein
MAVLVLAAILLYGTYYGTAWIIVKKIKGKTAVNKSFFATPDSSLNIKMHGDKFKEFEPEIRYGAVRDFFTKIETRSVQRLPGE